MCCVDSGVCWDDHFLCVVKIGVCVGLIICLCCVGSGLRFADHL